jgi:hypothetical protein
VLRNLGKAEKLYRRAATDSGGTLWVYSPPVRAGTAGRANRLSMGTSGLSFDLPPNVDPFDFFGKPAGAGRHEPMQGRQDIPSMLAAAENDDAPPQLPSAPDMHVLDDLRLALMVQQMAGFGRAVGENEWNQRGRNPDHRYDYFA